MLTRLINLMGAYVGSDLELTDSGVGDENPKGFWERRDVRSANEHLLASVGCDWDRVAAWGKRDVPADAVKAFDKASKLVALKLDGNRPWVIKDPRLCLTAGYWLKNLEMPLPIHVVRNPLEVAVSLLKRNEFPLDLGLALWEKYTKSAAAALASTDCIRVTFDVLLNDPIQAVHSIYSALRDHGVRSIEMPSDKEISRFVDPKLRRSALNQHVESYSSHSAIRLYDSLVAGCALEEIARESLSETSFSTIVRHETVRAKLVAQVSRDLVGRDTEAATEPNETTKRSELQSFESGVVRLAELIPKFGEKLEWACGEIAKDSARRVQSERDRQLLEESLRRERQHVAQLHESIGIAEATRAQISLRARQLETELAGNQIIVSTLRGELERMTADRSAALLAVERERTDRREAELRSAYVRSSLQLRQQREAECLEALQRVVAGLEETICSSKSLASLGDLHELIRSVVGWLSDCRSAVEAIHSSWSWRIGSAVVAVPSLIAARRRDPNALDFLLGHLSNMERALSAALDSWLVQKSELQVEGVGLLRSLIEPTEMLRSIVAEAPRNTTEHSSSEQHRQLPWQTIGTVEPSPRCGSREPERRAAEIVVCVHNAPTDVERLLRSLEPDLSADQRLILVNDGSELETTRMLREFSVDSPFVVLLEHPIGRGYTKAANHGLRHSTAEFVVLLNSDTIVPRGWVQGMLNCAFSSERIGLVGTMSNAASWQSIPDCLGFDGQFVVNPLPPGVSVSRMAQLTRLHPAAGFPRVPLLNGFCLGIKRSVIAEIGFLDEESFPRGYGEENDYCLRAANAGFEMAVATDVYIYHSKSKSYGAKERDRLSADASERLREKHGESAISEAVRALRENLQLGHARASAKKAIRAALLPAWIANRSRELSVMFLLPVKGGGGGSHSVVQEARAMYLRGIRVAVAVKKSSEEHFRGVYSDVRELSGFVFFYRDDAELAAVAADFRVVVATVFHSVALAKKIVGQHSEKVLVYYIQDYEPLFFEEGSEHYQQAVNSYGLVPQMVGMAKTSWICRTVASKHPTKMHRISPSIDHDVYFPRAEPKPHDRLVVSAMIRPSTPRRAPVRTLLVAKELKQIFGNSIQFVFFGASKDDSIWAQEGAEFAECNLGELRREGVAEVLRSSDIFLDLSDYQAFGRTGLEAMACGCVPAVPKEGGGDEYAVDGENALVIDTTVDSPVQIAHIVASAASNQELLQRMAKNGIATAARYSVESAALSELELFARLDSYDEASPTEATDSAPRIGVIHPTRGDGRPTGSAYIRSILPLQQLVSRSLIDVRNINCLSELDACDAVWVQRTAISHDEGIETLRSLQSSRRFRVIFEIDDRLWQMENGHCEFGSYDCESERIVELVRLADLVVVSTDSLRMDLARLNSNVHVIPNALDASLWRLGTSPAAPRDGEVLRILAMGTKTHGADLEMVMPALDKLWDRYEGRFVLDLVGMTASAPVRPWINVCECEDSEYPAFVSWLRETNRWHIGIAPLAPSAFNGSKSRIKILDLWALGLPVVASDIAEYRAMIQDGVDGFVASSSGQWATHIERLLLEPGFAAQMGRNGFQKLRSGHTLQVRWRHWWSAVARTLHLIDWSCESSDA
ncbi:glycosyltransferase [Pseudoxanthomonas sp. CAU 1598]|uniref:Glycosyltransferase n=2 Tax=Pseudomarimonas arenosa TaxID=2774145 RepID=A0AAW3ZID1_9GAMM|nr:glycosyltransferase [Pseudomarimonas arenosa]